MEKLLQYLDDNHIQYEEEFENLLIIADKRYYYEESKQLFNKDFELQFIEVDADYYVFLLGKRYYYTASLTDVDFKELLYIEGSFNGHHKYPFLGIHSGQELMNGSGLYEDWVAKAKFFEIEILGICESNTMAGFLKFQHACQDKGIKPVLGVSYKIVNDKGSYVVKLYVQDKEGYSNLLTLHKLMHESIEKTISENALRSHKNGLLIVVDPKKSPLLDYDFINYYQLDLPKFSKKDLNVRYMKSLENFIKSPMEPIYIQDAYYRDKQDSPIKNVLNLIESNTKDLRSNDQYMKDVHDFLDDFLPLFDDEDLAFGIFEASLNNLESECEVIDFIVDETQKHLPEYIMTKEESSIYQSNRDMFDSLIKQALIGRPEQYHERIKTEAAVIEKGGFIDYFLILYDIVEHCKEQNILTGIGRGCFAPNSRVILADGKSKKIRSVKKGDIVKNTFNEKSEVEDIYVYDVDEELVRLKFNSNAVIECTKDHKIWTKNRGWVEAQYLTMEDEF